LCEADGSLGRIAEVVRNRDQRTREFFAAPAHGDEPLGLAPELPAYLAALGALLEHRELAVDAGTGDGALLDVLAPAFRKVVAFDRSEAQLARARRRVQARAYQNVQLLVAELDDRALHKAMGAGADVVVASRVLHHAPLPRETLRLLVTLLRPGGHLLVLDYARHSDEALRDAQADVWMGFEPKELEDFAHGAGLSAVRVSELNQGLVQNDLDGHLPWLLLAAKRPAGSKTHSR
jgi:ArsR family transcriptional regulator